jgi:hypothetical protein
MLCRLLAATPAFCLPSTNSMSPSTSPVTFSLRSLSSPGLSSQIYCNVEGIAWLDDMRFIVSSDKAKKTQPYRCTVHDQSIGIFALP